MKNTRHSNTLCYYNTDSTHGDTHTFLLKISMAMAMPLESNSPALRPTTLLTFQDQLFEYPPKCAEDVTTYRTVGAVRNAYTQPGVRRTVINFSMVHS